MKLHTAKDDFKDLITATAQAMNIREVYVEKDYWVTFLLKRLTQVANKDRIVFKGGTSLSKGYGLIKRFSEDVDLAIIRDGLTNAASERLIKETSKFLADQPFTEIDNVNEASKKGLSRRTLHRYPREIEESNFGPVRDSILLEINCFGSPTPNEPKRIKAFVAEFLGQSGNEDAINEYGLEPFDILVLDYRRTFVEKILSLSYASFMDAENQDVEVRARVRHFYDLTVLSDSPEIQDFLLSDKFVDMVRLARQEEQLSSRTQWDGKALSSAPLHRKTKTILNSVEAFFHSDLDPMVYQPEDLPKFTKVRATFETIAERIREHSL